MSWSTLEIFRLLRKRAGVYCQVEKLEAKHNTYPSPFEGVLLLNVAKFSREWKDAKMTKMNTEGGGKWAQFHCIENCLTYQFIKVNRTGKMRHICLFWNSDLFFKARPIVIAKTSPRATTRVVGLYFSIQIAWSRQPYNLRLKIIDVLLWTCLILSPISSN